MPRTKVLPRELTNFDALLQDIRNVLGENYAFYQECVVAITRAARRRKNASAWFEQMAQVVEGVKAVTLSHAGVVFLLQELVRGEVPLTRQVPPPPLPFHITPPQPHSMDQQRTTMRFRDFVNSPSMTPSSASFTREATPAAKIASSEALRIPVEPLSGLKDPESDPIFFTDPRIRSDINAFWGYPVGSDYFTSFANEAHHPCKADASYNDPDRFIPRYDPAADDVKVFKKHGEHVVLDKNKGNVREAEGMIHEKELRQMRDELQRVRSDREAGVARSFTRHHGMQ